MNGTVSWFEVMGSDVESLTSFYGAVFDWKLVPLPDMDYHMTPPDWQGVPGGVGRTPAGPGWSTFYVKVDDVAAAADRAVAAGGQILVPPHRLPGGTTIAVVADPEGHPVGLSHSEA